MKLPAYMILLVLVLIQACCGIAQEVEEITAIQVAWRLDSLTGNGGSPYSIRKVDGQYVPKAGTYRGRSFKLTLGVGEQEHNSSNYDHQDVVLKFELGFLPFFVPSAGDPQVLIVTLIESGYYSHYGLNWTRHLEKGPLAWKKGGRGGWSIALSKWQPVYEDESRYVFLLPALGVPRESDHGELTVYVYTNDRETTYADGGRVHFSITFGIAS